MPDVEQKTNFPRRVRNILRYEDRHDEKLMNKPRRETKPPEFKID